MLLNLAWRPGLYILRKTEFQNLVLASCRMKANLEICHDNREGSKGWGRERKEGKERSRARLKIITAAHPQKGFVLTICVVLSVLVGIR